MATTATGRTRVVAAVIAIVTGAVLGLVAVNTIFVALFTGYLYSGELPLNSDRVPFQPDGAPPYSGEVWYSTLGISSAETLVGSRAASTVADVLHQLVLIAIAVLLITIAGSLLVRRPFTRVLRWGLVVLGALIVVSGAIAPQLDALAAGLAVQELGYPAVVIDGPGYEGVPEGEYALVTSSSWTYILMQVDAVLTAIGVALVLLGILIGDGIRLQRETEGLV
jgi:hypothetical protein